MDCSKGEGSSHGDQKRYKGVRCRKWGKWVSEIRIPGTRERLWLGSYTNPEAAAVAYDTAMFCLRGPSSANLLNFPSCLPSYLQADMSPKSIQRAATNAAMAVDYELGKRATQGADDKAVNEGELQVLQTEGCEQADDIVHGMNNDFHKTSEEENLNISIDDMEIYLG